MGNFPVKGQKGFQRKAECLNGHPLYLGNRYADGSCIGCKTSKDNLSKRAERRWKQVGIFNADGSSFTALDYDRAYQVQAGKCGICLVHQSNLKFKLQADHDHNTGFFRALLCARCNKVIGLADESQDTLTKMIEFLRSH
jgi:hypothetical protein